MAMKTEANAPISPMKHANGQQMGHDAETTHFLECTNAYIGLTKREYFAAMAMQGLITNAPMGQIGNYKDGSMLAIDWADALIAALNK